MHNMKYDEFIALYFKNNLNARQKAQFDDLMLNNAEFKAQVIFEEQIKKAVISTKKDELLNKLKQLEKPKKRFNFYAIAIAASLIIALGIFSLLQHTETFSNEQLFAEYFEPYSNIIAPASRGDETPDEKSEAFRYYDAKNYETASNKFDKLYATTKASYYLFYLGVCELQLGNTENAITLFKLHQKHTDKLSNQTHWYLALAHLKASNIKDAKALLQTIITKKSFKYKAAEDILKKLK